MLNRPVVRLKSSETETLGDFIIAAGSIGFSEIGSDFGKKVAAESEILYPDSEAVLIYERSYQKYKAIYEQTKNLFP